MSTQKLPYLVEPAVLYQQIEHGAKAPKLVIVDVGSAENYARGHVPGAIHLPYAWLISGAPPAPGTMANTDQLEQVLNHLGITPNSHVVVYDDDGGGHAGQA